ncbi:MAG: transposase [Herbinix sp.]|nr:transposase [Herbinix sp.]
MFLNFINTTKNTRDFNHERFNERGGTIISRKERVWYEGAIYHIVTRGNNKQKIFLCNEDYWQYMNYMRRINVIYPFKLYSYCLMSNHVHLQIATNNIEIWTIMRGINWRYSKYFNAKYEKVGHLFQNRYHSELIEDEAYLLQTSKYIHLNPVKAGIVDKPIKYPWSSYGVYMGVYKNSLIHEDETLAYFQYDRRLYKNFVESEDSVDIVDMDYLQNENTVKERNR